MNPSIARGEVLWYTVIKRIEAEDNCERRTQMIAYGLKRALRAPRKLIVYFFVAALICAFLCIGLNLKQTADVNLANVLDSFNVLALPDFKARINQYGQKVTEKGETFGYLPCEAVHYDLEDLLSLPGVIGIDARNRFGGCITNTKYSFYQERLQSQTALRYHMADVVIFELAQNEAVTIENTRSAMTIKIKRLWSASGLNAERCNLKVQNPIGKTGFTYTLQPGVTYIANLGDWGLLTEDIYHYPYRAKVNGNGTQSFGNFKDNLGLRAKYPAITEYYEGFWDTERGRYFQQSAEACYLNGNSATIITTSDLTAIPSWASGDIFLTAGRAFSEEDYRNGNQVCIVSKQFLSETGFQIGDTIDFSFFETSYHLSDYVRDQYSTFDPYLYDTQRELQEGASETLPMDHIFDKGSFTIIGAYDGNVCWRSDHESYLFNESMHWLMVLLPSTSVQNQPEVKLSQYMTSIQVEPMKLQKFLAAAQSSGLMEEQTYGYQLGLTVDDHGLSGMISGLEALQEISRLVLLLSSLTAGLAVLVLVILHLLQNRRQIAILRSMGIKKAQVAAFVTTGILLASLLGTVIGGLAGQRLSNAVAERILTTAQEDSVDDRFSAMTSVKTAEDATFELEVAADPDCTKIAVGSIFGAMLVLSVGAVLWESRKPPLLMLGVKE